MRTFNLLAFLVPACFAHGQTVLFTEGFEGPAPAIQLNTADVGSVVTSPDNTWVINNGYTGGSGNVVCLGFPLPFTVPNTAAQPAGIPNAGGNYMHISSQAALTSGMLNCCFLAADGLCANAASHFARMTTDVSTGATDVTLSFWWLCGGGASNYGEVYYSTDGGVNWTLVNVPIAQYWNQPTWVQQSITSAVFSNQGTLRFGFRFANAIGTAAQDPGFAVDAVSITQAGGVTNAITTGVVQPAAYCQSTAVQVPYTATGTFASGNVFSAELSDATGSFAAPVVIGTLAATTSGSINATIPPGTLPGTGYRIRVVSDMPAAIGTPFAMDLSISATPNAGSDVNAALCSNAPPVVLLGYVTNGDLNGVFLYQGQPAPLPDFSVPGVYPLEYVVQGNGPCANDTAHFVFTVNAGPNAGSSTTVTICNYAPAVALISLLGGNPNLNGSWTDPSGLPFNGILIPASSVSGLYTYLVTGTAPCVDAQSFVAVVLDPCVGIGEVTGAVPSMSWVGQEGSAHVFLAGTTGGDQFEVLDAMGRSCIAGKSAPDHDRIRIGMEGQATGAYLVRFRETGLVLRIYHRGD